MSAPRDGWQGQSQSKNGNHNLGGSVKQNSATCFHGYADGGKVAVVVKPGEDVSKLPKGTPTISGGFANLLASRADRMDAVERGEPDPGSNKKEPDANSKLTSGKANGGMVRRYADGGEVDPFRSNDDGGGGAWAARQQYESAQAQPSFRDADAMGPAEPVGPPAPSAPIAAEAAPSAMPAQITTLTPEEKAAKAGAAVADAGIKLKPFRMTGSGDVQDSFNRSADAGAKAKKIKEAKTASPGDSDQELASEAVKGKKDTYKSKQQKMSESVSDSLKKVGEFFAPKSQRSKKYT